MNAEPATPYLRDELDSRSLHFSSAAIQSRMLLQRPDALVLEYTRSMMAWPMLRPSASRVCLIGLGGGSIPKFCHRHLKSCRMTVVEIDPRVIALRQAFQVPPDDARLRVVEADGARFVAESEERYDVLMVDAFDAEGMPAALGSQRFYDDCLDLLEPAGLLVVNLHAGHPSRPLYEARIRRSFGARLLIVDDRDASNRVIFAAKGGRFSPPGAGSMRRPPGWSEIAWKELRGAFSRLAHALTIGDHEH